MRRRLDAEIVRRGLSESRTEAQIAVKRGLVTVGGRPATKASTLVGSGEAVHILGPPRRFVSRGGDKLEAALVTFGIDVAGMTCIDAGASTGGFTDCLLQRGASRVASVDVGYGQLAWSLRTDARVVLLERTNVRDLHASMLPFEARFVCADLSFISLRLVLGALARSAAADATFVLLVKPQFEAGAGQVGKGGVIRDPVIWERAILGVVAAASEHGLQPTGLIASPMLGPAGNVEFLLGAAATSTAAWFDVAAAIPRAIEARP